MNDRIGQYEILREVGRGGMGVVYLARDARLDRDVAIKSLPEHLASDPARHERFEREAKTLASVNHPNLAGIYGVEEHEGARYLVLEYVDGETLADRLDRGPLDVDEAVDLGAQIAAGIEAAHQAGVIHRDLKPANIRITTDGVAKVLDFGLARFDEQGSSSGTASAATVTTPHSLTMAGAILGTAAYMSPEQARGRRVDKRTDIWSFGVVLYEMLVGANPFVGETASDSIGAILHKDIDLARIPAATPRSVRRVLDRCMVRDKAKRYRDIGDIRLELLHPDSEPHAGTASSGAPFRSFVLPILLTAAIAAGLSWTFKPSALQAPLPVVEADILLPPEQRLAHRFLPGIAISPDGQSLAFCTGTPEQLDSGTSVYFFGQLMIRRLGQPAAVPVSGAGERPTQPTFSPDGTSIAYTDDFRTISRIPILGGAATQLFETKAGIGGLDWTTDGRILFGTVRGIKSIADTGGPVEQLTTVDFNGGEFAHVWPHALPGGRDILFTVWPRGEQEELFAVWVRDGRSGESRKLIDHAAHPQYAAGHIVFARRGTLMAVPFDTEQLTLTGHAKPVGIEVVHSLHGPNSTVRNSAAQFALAPGGNLAYAEGTVYPEIPRSVAWVDRAGTITELDLPPRAYGAARVEPQGARLLFTVFYDPNSALWVHDTNRGVTRRAHRGDGLSWGVWGPGDDEVTFTHDFDDGNLNVGWATVSQTGEPRRPGPFGEGVRANVAEWSPDREYLICLIREPGTPGTGIAAWSEADGWQRITDTPGVSENYPALSPDGQWIAYSIREDGTWNIYVKPFLRDGPVTQVTDGRAWSPVWSRDGTELFYEGQVSASDSSETWIMAVSVEQSGTGLEFGAPEQLFDESPFGGTIPIRSWDVADDGRFLMTVKAKQEDLQAAVEAFFPDRIRLVQNWTSRLAD